jgi:succinyl-diaminopimelate desuccinylase
MDHVDVLCRLIEYDTSAVDARGCLAALAYLGNLFGECGCQTVQIPIPACEADGLSDRIALRADRRMPGKPRLLVYGHIDVVPAEGWDAYVPRRAEGRIYGRGASDMKGSISALVGALACIRGVAPAFDLTVLLTMDEETHQMSQLNYLTGYLDTGNHPHVLSLDAGFGYVSVANLGLLQMDITVQGHSVHSALAHLGRNAIEDAVALMAPLLELKRSIVRRKSDVPTHPATGLDFMEPRLNINLLNGGIARNIVPDRCMFTIGRRLLPEETVDGARAEILATLNSVRGVDWSVKRQFSIPSVALCRDPLARVLAKAIAEVTGATGTYGEMLSGELPAAASLFWGGDAFATGVIRPDNHIHGMNEFVFVSDLDRLVDVLARFLTGDPKEAA